MHPKLRSDGRFVAGVGGGGARIVDVKTLVEVAGVGPMVVEPIAQFRTVAVAAGKARISLALGHQGPTMWLTQGPPPSIFDPPHGKNATVARTDTHLFVVEDEREGRTLTVYDPAGKELRKERMARFDASQIASKSVTLLRQGGCDELLCEADKPCRSVSLHGFVHSLFYPWVIVHPRAVCSDKEGERRLVDLRDGSSRALDGCQATGMLISDAPLIVCGGDTEEKVVTPDGKVVRTLPKKRSGPRHGTSSVVNAMPFRFGLGVTNFGLEPGERMNLETGERVELFFGNDFALAQFPDGAIERFGQRDAATRFLYCKDGSELLPWPACASTSDVTGRF